MWLFYSPFHSFVHKVRVVAHEAGLDGDVELVASFPFRNLDGDWVRGQYDTGALNPLGEVPFLVLDDGTVLYSSQVVVDYLARGTPLLPQDDRTRFDCLRRLALGDGLFYSAVQISMELWQPENERRAALFERLWPKIERGFAAIDAGLAESRAFDVGDAGLLQGISYVDCRPVETQGPAAFLDDWRGRWPRLADWYDTACERPSVSAHLRQPVTFDTGPERHAQVIADAMELQRARN